MSLQDYNITMYCAEAINTVTNLIFIWLGVRGIRNCLQYSHPRVIIVAYAGYIVVGLGSMAFHTTLKCMWPSQIYVFSSLKLFSIDSMQLADELPMIYTTCIMAFAALSYKQSERDSVLIGTGLATLAGLITVSLYSIVLRHPSLTIFLRHSISTARILSSIRLPMGS
jgi:dihydroceramidase